MIKMIVSDMDGTLLNSKKQLPLDFAEVYDIMTKANIRFVVASGRQFYTLVDEFNHMNHNMSFVAENGGYIHWDNQSLVTKSLGVKDAAELIKAIRNIDGANIVLCCKSGAYIEDSSSTHFMDEMSKYYVRHSIVDDLLDVDDEILKIAVNNFDNLESTTYPIIKKVFADDFQVSTSSTIWLDIMAKGVDKGMAINMLQKELGILPEETMAFGDYLNDYEMLQQAHYSYAMDNAHEDIKRVAQYATESNDDNGVMNAIRRKLLEK